MSEQMWQRTVPQVLIPLGLLAALTPWCTPTVALVSGVALALLLGNPWQKHTRLLSRHMLAWSVVGLGAGMDIKLLGKVGLQGLGYTFAGITCTLLLGAAIGRKLGVARDTRDLVSVGTAICGGSAIAAVAPVIRAKEHEVSMSLAIVFLLNALALVIFPMLGRYFGLDQRQFGLWAALAIHDTSSVVGAAVQYGPKALEVATAAKLARALWITPVAFFYARLRKSEGQGKVKWPWFILGFVAAAALATYVPALEAPGHMVALAARHVLTATLFLIGLNVSRESLASLGYRPAALGVGLWIIAATGTLVALKVGLIA